MSNTTSYAYAPFTTSYAARTPLISVAEYQAAPTGISTNNLLTGTPQDQVNALQETIGRASSWCDQYCFGSSGCIAATVETENARIWGSYRYTLPVKTRYWPVLEVRSFSYSPLPGGLANNLGASVTPSQSITIYPQEFEVAIQGGQTFVGNLGGFGGFGTTGVTFRTEYDCLWQYCAGWPNTTLAASVAAGSQSIQPSSVVGIYPNTPMTMYDLPLDEPIVVASTYVPGASVVPLASPLQFNHTANATVTNMPPAIKQAAILATTAFIKQRGSGALMVQDISSPITTAQTGTGAQQSGSDWTQAMELLNPFRQQVVSY